MKTLKQKAKAYDGLIERLKDLKFACRFSPLSDTIEEIFPELEESEDEKIREALIRYFTLSDDNAYNEACGVSYRDIVAWLEKQWQKPTDKVELKFKVGDTVKDPYGDLYHITEIIDDSYKTDDGRFILFKNQEVYTLFNFTAWSEEDDRMYNRIISFIPQHLTAESYTACINWFKGLKDRVQPQPQWKPSDTEINILYGVIDGSFKPENVKLTLTNILEQLKKLREE